MANPVREPRSGSLDRSRSRRGENLAACSIVRKGRIRTARLIEPRHLSAIREVRFAYSPTVATRPSGRDDNERVSRCVLARWPYPPVCGLHANPFIGFGRDPSADDATTRKRNSVRTVFFNDGQLKLTGVRRGRYWLPIHLKIISHYAIHALI